MRTRIKICGVTRAEDAAVAVAAGADAIGVIFAPSKRQVTLEQAALVTAAVPPPVARVGVFVDPSREEVEAAIAAAGLTAVQLCGSETPEFCASLGIPVMKVLHVGTGFGWETAEPFRGYAAALLLDTLVTGKAGGTSQAFAWHDIGEPPAWAPVFLAGGLGPHNVADAIAALHPFAVDVSSGVEREPGIKDPVRIAAFCDAVYRTDSEDRS